MMRTQIFVSLGACVLLTCGCGSGSSQNDVRQGMAAFNAKNYTEAIAHLSRATQRITDSADLYYQLGAAHLEKGELDPAAEAFQAARRRRGKKARACCGIAAHSLKWAKIRRVVRSLPKRRHVFGRRQQSRKSMSSS